MTLKSQLRSQFRTRTKQLSAIWLDEQPAWLGDDSGNETVLTEVPGVYYARLINGKVIRVYNQARVAPDFDKPVKIGRSRSMPNIWQIIEERESYLTPVGGDRIEYHHEQHEEKGPDRLNLDRKQIVQLSVRVYDAANFVVKVLGGIVPTANGNIVIPNQDLDLSSYVVTTGAKWIAIESDDDGALTIAQGAAFGSPSTFTSANLPARSSGKYPIAYVLFYDGQSELADPDIVASIPLPGSGGGSGGAVDSVNGQTGVVVLDPDDLDDTSTTNKFTTAAEISKLAGIEAGAEVNNISDTNATDLTDGGETTLHSHPASGGGLTYNAANITTSNLNAAEGNFYDCTIGGMTADRDFVLPTPSAAGKVIGVRIKDGDNLYELIIKANSVEITRLFIAKECMYFRSTGTGAGDWMMEIDGRIPCVVQQRASAQQSNLSPGVATKITLGTSMRDNASMNDLANNRIVARRAGTYMAVPKVPWYAYPSADPAAHSSVWKNGAAALDSFLAGSSNEYNVVTYPETIDVAAGDYLELYGTHYSGGGRHVYYWAPDTSWASLLLIEVFP